jgi:flavin-dependent dehydrogenase
VERADVLIVGGGPAGSACATALAASGRDVLVLDKSAFPRDKPCAGWITPEALARTGLEAAEYARRHTLQPISGFRVGRIGGRALEVDYGKVVSYAIRRSELDAELLRRSGARSRLGQRVDDVRRRSGRWVLEGRWAAPLLIGAGGHFCPVARRVSGAPAPAATVVARQIEYRLEGEARAACRVRPEQAELYFCRDLLGYGWCVRKGDFLNVGLGRRDPRALPRQLAAFVEFLVDCGRIASPPARGWRGHAYLVREGAPRLLGAEGVLLAGDAAGLAFATSGEGILPAIVSGQAAAQAVLSPDGLGAYVSRLRDCLGSLPRGRRPPRPVAALLVTALLGMSWFVRQVVLDRWFLHRTLNAGLERSKPEAGSPLAA